MKRYRNILTVIAIALFTVLCLSSCFCCYDYYDEPLPRPYRYHYRYHHRPYYY